VDFKLSAGVKGTDGQPSCVDEEDGCPTEAFILCGFEQLTETRGHVDFLACMDESDGAAGDRARACAAKQQLDAAKLEACASGTQGAGLLQAAHEYFVQHQDEVSGFPTLLVDNQEVLDRDWGALTEAFCKAGAECACGLPPPSPAVSQVAV